MAVNIISLDEMRRLLESGQALHIIDVRTPAEFARVHVAGARLVPLDRLDPSTIAKERKDPQTPLYVICQSGMRAAKACQKLADTGNTQVFSIEGGTVAWEKAGLPVERGGGKVMPLERQVRIAAGLLVLAGSVLAWLVHPYFLAVPAFVGAGLIFAGITDTCGMAMILTRMPWNRRGLSGVVTCATTT